MSTARLWVVEVQEANGRWGPTVYFEFSREDGRVALRDVIETRHDERFRLRAYERVEAITAKEGVKV